MSTLATRAGIVVPDGSTMDIFESGGNARTGLTPGDYDITLVAIDEGGTIYDLVSVTAVPEGVDVRISQVQKWDNPIASIIGPTIVVVGWRNEAGSVGALANVPHSSHLTYRNRPS